VSERNAALNNGKARELQGAKQELDRQFQVSKQELNRTLAAEYEVKMLQWRQTQLVTT
jgi:hypothetical protein